MARMAVLALGVALASLALLAQQTQAMRLQATIGQVSGGSCGYTNWPPPGVLVTGFSEAIYLNGAMCGSCFKVQCVNDANCIKGRYINVMVTSICQSENTTDVCNTGNQALNLDPRAWDLIVSSRAMGQVPVELYSVSCPQMAGGVQFNVSVASAYYFQVLIQNVGGMGRLLGVQVSADGVKFFPMYRNYGSVWAVERVNLLGKPLTFKLTDMKGEVLTLANVMPANWGKASYQSTLNFPLPKPKAVKKKVAKIVHAVKKVHA